MAETQQEMLRRLREQAWDEGYKACQQGLYGGKKENPYKKRDHDGSAPRGG